jgi:hypothetical protein
MQYRPLVGVVGITFGIASVTLFFSACGSAPPPPATPPAPEPAKVAVAEPPPVAPAETTLVDAGAAEADAETPPVAEPAPAKRSQKPIDMLTARDAAFLVDYANSPAKEKAQKVCEQESKGDAEKQGACLTKAREKFLPDVLRFRKDSETQLSLLVYKRTASSLRELWIGVVELSEPSEDSVKVKILPGRQKGTRPLWQGRSDVVISVPNEYSIEFDDPTLGHLRYDAKIGLITQ